MRRRATKQSRQAEAYVAAQAEEAVKSQLLELTRQILEAIHAGDADTYAQHCAPDLTCFEELAPYRIDGIDFHRTVMQKMAENPALAPARCDMVTPHVQLYGDAAVVTYTRLMSYFENGFPRMTTANETRIFIKQAGEWRMVHFHRSPTR